MHFCRGNRRPPAGLRTDAEGCPGTRPPRRPTVGPSGNPQFSCVVLERARTANLLLAGWLVVFAFAWDAGVPRVNAAVVAYLPLRALLARLEGRAVQPR